MFASRLFPSIIPLLITLTLLATEFATQVIGAYRLVTDGICADSGFQNIYDSVKCKAAAVSLGKSIVWGPHGGYPDVVNGCSVRDNPNFQLFLNPPDTCTSFFLRMYRITTLLL